jgi:hypothetical protein
MVKAVTMSISISSITVMDVMLRSVIGFIAVVFLIGMLQPANAWCIFSCEPSEATGKQVLENVLLSMFKTPVVVSNFKKTNARKATMGVEMYEIQYQADIDFPQGFVPRPSGFWDEFTSGAEGNARVTDLRGMMTWTVKSSGTKFWEPHSLAAIGAVVFVKTEKGWQARDGRLY